MPRQILPGSTYLITRRCTQRQFLLKPSPLTNQVIAYCYAIADRLLHSAHRLTLKGHSRRKTRSKGAADQD